MTTQIIFRAQFLDNILLNVVKIWISSKNAHNSGNKYYFGTKASHIDSIQDYISLY